MNSRSLPVARRWLRYSLRTLVVVLTLGGTVGYWLACKADVWRQQREYERLNARWEAELASADEVCEASLRLCRAESAVPFADRHRAASAHLSRVEKVWASRYGPLGEWLQGVGTDAELKEAQAGKAVIDGYVDQAKRMASETK